ncbi:4-hydroxythreonine-4-phosphate dehydrogenase [Angulomicrobium tetraedrale]|uniref:4-hydroxythreonine-4-phosphate dehydrogenase n=1 Tax=Ancylobacter tetraedralis TaxID=217068 RepID=A0A839Z950_9HYPH|nr:4-hydroxythreonine-4-phosphate dehydrogenase PdxA [Ancylobacter tetraedralis]MBB3770277.1 4-hydroxythreonine-4-phosphate dehydrogenase [Ancylobacter tetraedralis]
MPLHSAPPSAALALSLGEPAGIGPDIALRAWVGRHTLHLPAFFVTGDADVLRRRAARLGLRVPVRPCAPEEAVRCFAEALPVVAAGPSATAEPGLPDATSGPAALAAIDAAVRLVQAGRAAAIVTNPIAKSVLYADGFTFPGHTEYLAHLAGSPARQPVMMIWSPELAVIPATIHIPVAEIARHFTRELLVDTGRIAARDLTERFGLARPRLAFCGLNPHAGEQGTIGREDEEITRPAVEALQREGIDARGPFPADTLFHARAREGYDVVIGAYHDQVLAPVKMLAFERAVNVTLGLPFVRTSPDHGTAFDIAGTGQADPSSLIEALRLARKLADADARRQATHNPARAEAEPRRAAAARRA